MDKITEAFHKTGKKRKLFQRTEQLESELGIVESEMPPKGSKKFPTWERDYLAKYKTWKAVNIRYWTDLLGFAQKYPGVHKTNIEIIKAELKGLQDLVDDPREVK